MRRHLNSSSTGKRVRGALALLIILSAGGTAYAAASGNDRSFAPPASTPPAPSIVAAPPHLSDSPQAQFSFTDSTRGVEFHCQLDGGPQLDCSSPRLYVHLSDGKHTFSVWASIGEAGKLGAPATYSWTIDTVPPPAPQIVQHPAARTAETSAAFGFVDPETGATFECSLDGGRWSACTSPTTYKALHLGAHAFSVRAVDAAGNRSKTTELTWVIHPEEHSESFSISGSPLGLLYPGASPTAIGVTMSNPSAVTIYVTAIQVMATGGAAGCASASNIALTQSNASSATPVSVPAHGSVTLPAQGVSAPTIQLRDLPVNQNACEGAKFAISYTGSAHS